MCLVAAGGQIRAHRRRKSRHAGYTLALYGHRYLEYGIVQIFSKSVLDNSGLAQVIVGG